jgi:hypothetical protein
MRVINFAVFASILFPAITWGGQINGTVFRDGQPVERREYEASERGSEHEESD